MKLSMQLDPPENRDFFTSLDVVHGVVVLDVSNGAKISQVKVTLEGKIQTSAISSDDGNPSAITGEGYSDQNRKHSLFKSTCVLFPVIGLRFKPGGYTLVRGRHLFRFGIDFPALSTCMQQHPWLNADRIGLPPSLTVKASKTRVRVAYLLRTKVTSAGVFNHATRSEQEVRFIPLDPPIFPEMRALEGQKHVQALPLELLGLAKAPNRMGFLPPYSPAIFIEGTIQGSNILLPGQLLPLNLVASFPNVSSARWKTIWLRRIDISIRRKTIQRVGQWSNVHFAEITLANIITNIPLRSEMGITRMDVDDGFWSEVRIPNMTPSFSSCILSEEHELQILVEFVTQKEWKSASAIIRIPVLLHVGNGPPPYESVLS